MRANPTEKRKRGHFTDDPFSSTGVALLEHSAMGALTRSLQQQALLNPLLASYGAVVKVMTLPPELAPPTGVVQKLLEPVTVTLM